MKQILFATSNIAKLKRFEKLNEKGIKVLTLKDINLNIDDVEETGKNAVENAIIKAKYWFLKTNIPTFAMDDNLYIENIPDEIQPGPYVRRVNGKKLDDEEMIKYYSNMAKKYGDKNSNLIARWEYAIALLTNNNGLKTYKWSRDNFYITSIPSDNRNPGYPLDSISKNINDNTYFVDKKLENNNCLNKNVKTQNYNKDNEVIEFILNILEKEETYENNAS